MVARSFFRNLSADHERLRDLVANVKLERDPERLIELAAKLDVTLRNHFEVEDTTLYPTLLEAVDGWKDRTTLIGAHEDHRLILRILDELRDTQPTDERFHGKVHSLDRLWSHHVEEEEDRLYEMARQYLTHARFADLADRVQVAQTERALDE